MAPITHSNHRRMRALAIAFAVQASALPVSALAGEEWECRDLGGNWDNPLVIARNDLDQHKGTIAVAGTTYGTAYAVAGFDRRWEWRGYAFVIEPNGDGDYYDFTKPGPGDVGKSSLRFNCRQMGPEPNQSNGTKP